MVNIHVLKEVKADMGITTEEIETEIETGKEIIATIVIGIEIVIETARGIESANLYVETMVVEGAEIAEAEVKNGIEWIVIVQRIPRKNTKEAQGPEEDRPLAIVVIVPDTIVARIAQLTKMPCRA